MSIINDFYAAVSGRIESGIQSFINDPAKAAANLSNEFKKSGAVAGAIFGTHGGQAPMASDIPATATTADSSVMPESGGGGGALLLAAVAGGLLWYFSE